MEDVNIDLTIENIEESEIEDNEIKEIVDKLLKNKKEHADKKKETTELYNKIQSLETTLHNKMESMGLRAFKTNNATVFRRFKYWGKITDEQKAREFFSSEGIDKEMFKTTIAAGRLNDMVKKFTEEGIPIPDGIDFTVKPSVGIRRR